MDSQPVTISMSIHMSLTCTKCTQENISSFPHSGFVVGNCFITACTFIITHKWVTDTLVMIRYFAIFFDVFEDF